MGGGVARGTFIDGGWSFFLEGDEELGVNGNWSVAGLDD